MKLEEKYLEALESLSIQENYIAIQICRLGIPIEDKSIPTACVAWDGNNKKVKFKFNPKFADSLTEEEFQFVLAHESIHLLNGHVPLLKNKLDEMERRKKKDFEIYKFQKKFNIAADCVVNDSLVNLYGFKKVMTEKTKEKPKIIYGMDFVDRDCHDLTVMEVFSLLKDEKIKGMVGEDLIHDWDSFFDDDGNLIEDFVDQIKGFYQTNGENSNMSDEDLDNMQKLKQHFEKSSDAIISGDGKVGAYRAVDNMSKLSINWGKLAGELIQVKKQENTWAQPNKKLISVYPTIMLPTLVPEEKEEIFIAIDASASIDHKALSLFINLVKNIATKFKITAISFDDECYPYDIKGKDDPQGGGGTDFEIVEEWIKTNLKKYPKAVFMLTDGEGSEVVPKYPDRWCFILYGRASKKFVGNMRNFNIKDLIK